ncbi:EpsG family protein [Pseudoalteromonas carrageenovora]|uniref:EpsG family protein n=1 Tax=Pseudoalteromonas carrageenovora TaxID=227 RepID=UPI0026E43FBE|nr:EpsG family protein [Pseudoalteromonas carrageenovora]MDO6548919.1 EpsG family protein [Pseudoalteromonas carrageenovora]MDO6833424.1 EpsG family protein [Pseudoalteromonas carrageenovora]
MNWHIKRRDFYLFSLKLILLVVLFLLMNFDKNLNADYPNYLANYKNDWWQFEFGFEAISFPFKILEADFSTFWVVVLIVEVFLISILYRNNAVFLFAFPNLLFISQGFLGTQVRFGLAISLFLVIFSFFYKKKYFWFLSLLPILFHNASVVVCFLSNSVRYLLNDKRSIFLKRNVFWLGLFVVASVLLSLLMNHILMVTGYYYYVGTKYQEGKSLSSLIYLLISLLLLLFLLARNINIKYSEYVYLSFVMVVFSLIFAKSSVISGRFTLVYTMLEPFVLYYFYQNIGKKKYFFPIFIFYCVICYIKLITVNFKV